MSFFTDKCHLADLNTTDDVLVPYCTVRQPLTLKRQAPPGGEMVTVGACGLCINHKELLCGAPDATS
jgi:hypothetical protein